MPDIKGNIQKLKERISSAAKRANRGSSNVLLIAATKDAPAEMVREAISCGITDIGENKVQDAGLKYGILKDLPVRWHMIGHLQTNKAKKAVEIFSMVQSVDSEHLAQKLSEEAVKAGKKLEILIEINTSGEASKYGIIPEKASELIGYASKLPNLSVKGLMTVGALTQDKERIRGCFRLLRNLAGVISNAGFPGVEMKWLSMGMTDDLEIAIEEGSNMIRIGRAIFEQPHKH